jgi:hypothetical protein
MIMSFTILKKQKTAKAWVDQVFSAKQVPPLCQYRVRHFTIGEVATN